MVILSVYSRNIKITYKSTLFSKATLVAILFGVITVVLPFIFAYKSNSFWLKRGVFYEQPDVKFNGEFAFLATTTNVSRAAIFCSTIPKFENKLEGLDACPTVRVRDFDINFDGKVDEFSLDLDVVLPEKTQIASIHIIVLFDYKLLICPLQMQAAIIFQKFLPAYVSSFQILGNVNLVQITPIVCHPQQTNNFYNKSVVSSEFELNEIVTKYSKRNVSTVLTNVYTTFGTMKSQKFRISLDVTIPEDKIYYRPRVWQVLKWAWIQYFSIYVIVAWCANKIKEYVFTRRLVLFYEDDPVKKKQ